MSKIKTSKKQKDSMVLLPKRKLKAGVKVTSFNPSKYLNNEKFIAEVIWECLKNNDPEGVMEALEVYFETVNKSRFSDESKVPRSTLYHSLAKKNPTLKTLAKLVNAAA